LRTNIVALVASVPSPVAVAAEERAVVIWDRLAPLMTWRAEPTALVLQEEDWTTLAQGLGLSHLPVSYREYVRV
jgi:hypothetical protein